MLGRSRFPGRSGCRGRAAIACRRRRRDHGSCRRGCNWMRLPMPKIAICVVPVIMLLTASPPPLNGTRTMSMPCFLLKLLDERRLGQRWPPYSSASWAWPWRSAASSSNDLTLSDAVTANTCVQIERLGDRREALHRIEAGNRIDHRIGDQRPRWKGCRRCSRRAAPRRRRARRSCRGAGAVLDHDRAAEHAGPARRRRRASRCRSGRRRLARRSRGSAWSDSPAQRRAAPAPAVQRARERGTIDA